MHFVWLLTQPTTLEKIRDTWGSVNTNWILDDIKELIAILGVLVMLWSFKCKFVSCRDANWNTDESRWCLEFASR